MAQELVRTRLSEIFGGTLTLITSGLDSRVTLAAPNVAAVCDHSGMAFDRASV